MIRISKRFWKNFFVKLFHRCNTNHSKQHLGPTDEKNSDSGQFWWWTYSKLPTWKLPPSGHFWGEQFWYIHTWDDMKWIIFEIEISLTMKDPWGGVNKMQIQMWCRTLRQIGRAPCTTAISNREHWACIVYRPSVYCTITYKCFSLKIRFFHCFFFFYKNHVSSIPVHWYKV